VAVSQLAEAGVSSSTVSSWVAAGWLRWCQPGVVALAGSPETYLQRLMAALLAAGPDAAVSHRAAGFLWGMVPDAPVEIVVPRGQTPDLRGVIVHQTRDPFVVHRRQGLRVTSPMRALVDLGAVLPAAEVEDALDRALAVRLFSVAAVEWALAKVARPGRRGSGVLRRVLDERALADEPPDGLLEPRFARLCRTHGLPPAAFQHEVRFRGRTYRIDFAYPDLRIAIEVDGYGQRATRAAFESDTERQTILGLLGWTVLRFTWTKVVRRPAEVARDVLLAIGRADTAISV
jgi:very-short-patch-repair endonuclease